MKRNIQRKKEKVRLLESPLLAGQRWLRHGFTTRGPGDFNLSYSTARQPARVEKNRRALLRALDSGKAQRGWQLVTLRQRHTDIIRVIAGPAPEELAGSERERDGAVKLTGDAVATDQPGFLQAVQVADCLPILLADPERRVVAAVHAGWRGTLARIAAKAVGRLQQQFNAKPSQLLAAIGPGIHPCCYEVGPEVAEAYEARFPYGEKLIRRTEPSPSQVHWQQPLLEPKPGKRRARPAATAPETATFHLDLVEATRWQLLEAGMKARHLWVSPHCTACRTDLFFSHRAEQGRTGRMMGLIGIIQG